MIATKCQRKRRGATVVETALVLSVFLMFLFGIFEYARYIAVLQISTNAARDGARYAVINSANFTGTADTSSTYAKSPTTKTFSSTQQGYSVDPVTTYTTARMGGTQGMISDFKVRVYPCDAAKMYQDPPVIEPKTSSTAWNNAQFGEQIAVEIMGTYSPILPSFLFMSGTTDFFIVAVSGSEG